VVLPYRRVLTRSRDCYRCRLFRAQS